MALAAACTAPNPFYGYGLDGAEQREASVGTEASTPGEEGSPPPKRDRGEPEDRALPRTDAGADAHPPVDQSTCSEASVDLNAQDIEPLADAPDRDTPGPSDSAPWQDLDWSEDYAVTDLEPEDAALTDSALTDGVASDSTLPDVALTDLPAPDLLADGPTLDASPDAGPTCPNSVCEQGESCDGRSGTILCPDDCPGRSWPPHKIYCCVEGVCVGADCPVPGCP